MLVASQETPGGHAAAADPARPQEPAPVPAENSAATVAQLVGRTLAGLGVGHVFGVVGSGNFEVTNALRPAGVPFTAARHEGGAATMADAYSRMSGRVGVVSTHQGCGLSNADHRHRGGCQEPHPDDRADRRHPGLRRALQLQDRPGRPGPQRGRRGERVHSPATAVADTRPGLPHRA